MGKGYFTSNPPKTALVVAVLLLSGGVGARQPAVRAALPLPVPASEIAATLELPSSEPSRLVVEIVRLLFSAPGSQSLENVQSRARLSALLTEGRGGDQVPLPLDPSIWRDTILGRSVPNEHLVAAILEDRTAGLMYHGLMALDDETLAWLGPERETLRALRSRAGVFATFGRSIRVRSGRVVVPGGEDAEPIWEALVGIDPGRPGPFVRRLFSGTGRLAWMYDTIAHLEPGQQRFALAADSKPPARIQRAETLLASFSRVSREWRINDRPFSRPPVDPPVILSLIATTDDGRFVGPASRALWEQVFAGDRQPDIAFGETPLQDDGPEGAVDASWLTATLMDGPQPAGRRRLHTVLFAQRVFGEADLPHAVLFPALRGFVAFPALMVTLERMGLGDPHIYGAAARHAAALSAVRDRDRRRTAVAQFQSLLALLERAVASGGLQSGDARRLLLGLLLVPPAPDHTYESRLGAWIRGPLARALPDPGPDDVASIETALLAALAGRVPGRTEPPAIEWEGRHYVVDPATSEFHRLLAIRERQGGPTLDEALEEGGLDGALISLVYALHLGEPDGQALAAGNVALRHDLFGPTGRASAAWLLPYEQFGGPGGWRAVGSLLGLEHALARLAVRRLDPGNMPAEPKLSTGERRTAMLTVALLRPSALTDAGRDLIAAALARGRARVASLANDRTALEQLARETGLSEWRREALAWLLTHDPDRVVSQFSALELLWAGQLDRTALRELDPWGAAAFPLTGCLCLAMPAPRAWEESAGRPVMGQLAARGADVTILVAEALAERRLPAALAPAVVAYAMQDVTDGARPAHFDDWDEFGRSALRLTAEQLDDYIAALAAAGPLVAAGATPSQQ